MSKLDYQAVPALWGLRDLSRCVYHRKRIHGAKDSGLDWMKVGEHVTGRRPRARAFAPAASWLGERLLMVARVLLPVAVWHVLYLRGAVPLVVVQILVGIALGPTLFGRFAPEGYRPSPSLG